FSFAQSRRDIDIVFEASAVQLTPNDGRSRLDRLSLVSGETRRDIAIKPGQRVVLAGGGIGNAQLMLAPTGNSEIGLGNETDMVGRCLMEHPHFYSVARTVMSRSMTFPAVPDAFGRHAFAVVAEPTLRDRIGGLSVSMEFAPVTPNTKDPTESYLQRKFGPDALTHILNVRSEMRPDPNNRVTLLAERDPAGLPRPKAVCSFGGDDLRAVNEALLALGHRLAEQDLGRLRIDNDILFRQATGGGHTMGTTRMGADPATSVVDADCRVHRYDNVYVAGSSVFTTGGASNPTLTIAALAARLADHLAEAQT
ncbi:MAG: GMC oxidoreductase, partial [Pseudomonadota bacterium]